MGTAPPHPRGPRPRRARGRKELSQHPRDCRDEGRERRRGGLDRPSVAGPLAGGAEGAPGPRLRRGSLLQWRKPRGERYARDREGGLLAMDARTVIIEP